MVLVGLTLCNVLLYYGGLGRPAHERRTTRHTRARKEGRLAARIAISMKNFPAGSAENSA
ncbi:MAG: hypothetical protein ACK56F_10455 [bacterium]